MSHPFTVHLLTWQNGEPLLRAIREEVFIREQGVSPNVEWDGLDESSQHALALTANGEAVGCGRITRDGKIGRIAVLPAWRGQRIGSTILEALLDYAHSQDYQLLELNAQIAAVKLYRRFEFSEVGEVFMDANMPHIKMQLHLKQHTLTQ